MIHQSQQRPISPRMNSMTLAKPKQQRPSYRRALSHNNIFDAQDDDSEDEKHPYRHRVSISPHGFRRRRYGRVGSSRSMYVVPSSPNPEFNNDDDPVSPPTTDDKTAESTAGTSDEESIAPLDMLHVDRLDKISKRSGNRNEQPGDGDANSSQRIQIKTSRSWSNPKKPMRGTRKMITSRSVSFSALAPRPSRSRSSRALNRKDSSMTTQSKNSTVSSVSLLGMDSATALTISSEQSSSTTQQLAPGNSELRWNALSSSRMGRSGTGDKDSQPSAYLHLCLTPPSRRPRKRLTSADSSSLGDSLEMSLDLSSIVDDTDDAGSTTMQQQQQEVIPKEEEVKSEETPKDNLLPSPFQLVTSPESGRKVVLKHKLDDDIKQLKEKEEEEEEEVSEEVANTQSTPATTTSSSLPISELKLLLRSRGIVYQDCLEKEELLEQLQQSNASSLLKSKKSQQLHHQESTTSDASTPEQPDSDNSKEETTTEVEGVFEYGVDPSDYNKEQKNNAVIIFKARANDDEAAITEPETEDPTDSTDFMNTSNDTLTDPQHHLHQIAEINDSAGQDTCEFTISQSLEQQQQGSSVANLPENDESEFSVQSSQAPAGEETVESNSTRSRQQTFGNKILVENTTDNNNSQDNPYGYEHGDDERHDHQFPSPGLLEVTISDDDFNFTESSSDIVRHPSYTHSCSSRESSTFSRPDWAKMCKKQRRGSTGNLQEHAAESNTPMNSTSAAEDYATEQPRRKPKRRGSTGALIEHWEEKTSSHHRRVDDEALELNSSRRGSRTALVDVWEEKSSSHHRRDEEAKELNASRRGPRTALAAKWSQELLPKITTKSLNNEKARADDGVEEEVSNKEAMAKKRQQRLKARGIQAPPSFKKSRKSMEKTKRSSMKNLQESEKELARLVRKQKIDAELGRIVRHAEDIKLGFEIDDEVIRALRRAAMALTYTKMFYDVMKDEFIQFPTIAQAMMDYTLFEAAEKMYREKDDLLPIQSIAALRSTAEHEVTKLSGGMDVEYMDKIGTDLGVSSHHCSAFVKDEKNHGQDFELKLKKLSRSIELFNTVQSVAKAKPAKKKRSNLLRGDSKKTSETILTSTPPMVLKQQSKSLKKDKVNKRAKYEKSSSTSALASRKMKSPSLSTESLELKSKSHVPKPKSKSLEKEKEIRRSRYERSSSTSALETEKRKLHSVATAKTVPKTKSNSLNEAPVKKMPQYARSCSTPVIESATTKSPPVSKTNLAPKKKLKSSNKSPVKKRPRYARSCSTSVLESERTVSAPVSTASPVIKNKDIVHNKKVNKRALFEKSSSTSVLETGNTTGMKSFTKYNGDSHVLRRSACHAIPEDGDEVDTKSKESYEVMDVGQKVKTLPATPTLKPKKKAPSLSSLSPKPRLKGKSVKKEKANKRPEYSRSCSTSVLETGNATDISTSLSQLLPPKKKKYVSNLEPKDDTHVDPQAASKSKARGRSKSKDSKKKSKSRSRSKRGKDTGVEKKAKDKKRSSSSVPSEKTKRKQRGRDRSRSIDFSDVGTKKKRSSSKSKTTKGKAKKRSSSAGAIDKVAAKAKSFSSSSASAPSSPTSSSSKMKSKSNMTENCSQTSSSPSSRSKSSKKPTSKPKIVLPEDSDFEESIQFLLGESIRTSGRKLWELST